MNLEKQYKMNFRKIGCAVIMLTLTLSAAAQSESGKKFEYRIKAGFNIGGTLPIPLPAEIRKIESYSPTMAFTVEGSVLRWFTPKWALTTGLRFETKGMNAGAKVKNYQMTLLIENGDKTGEMSGRFTGRIKTRVQNEYITLPILVVRELSPAGRSNSAPTSPTASTAALPGRLSTATSATETRPAPKSASNRRRTTSDTDCAISTGEASSAPSGRHTATCRFMPT